jgi:DNA repair ATPase RecN
MNSINIEIERIKKKFFIQRLKSELEELNENDPRYDYISKIYNELTSSSNDLNKMLDEASNNVYTKKWNRMPNYHKMQKIREYLDETRKYDPKRNEIEKLLMERIKDGKLNSCKFVDYDSTTFKIKKITLSKTEIY